MSAARVFVMDPDGELPPLVRDALEDDCTGLLRRYLSSRQFTGVDAEREARARYVTELANGSDTPVSREVASASRPEAGTTPYPLCEDCYACQSDPASFGICATHRRACEGCGRQDTPLHGGGVSATKRGPNDAELRELWCAKCDPIEADPWDLASEELFTTCDLPRETPQYYGRDRGEWDARDDKQDLQPFTRTGKP